MAQAPRTEQNGKNRISRRLFVRTGSAAMGSAIVGVTAGRFLTGGEPAGASTSPEPATTRRLAMVVDLDRCTGCMACAVACKAENGVRLGGFRSWVSSKEVGRYPDVTRIFLPRLCNHCTHPPCLDVCPTGATFKRDDGLVGIDKARCIGCRHCMGACPYNARYFNPSGDEDEAAFPSRTHGTVDKCDLCAHRIDNGVVPACVNTCPTSARTFGDMHDPESEVHRLIASGEVTPLLPEFGTQPSVFYKGGRPEAFRLV